VKPDTILLLDADGDCEETLARAAARLGYIVRWVRTRREAFVFLNDELRNLALLIVDLDPCAYSFATLDALIACLDSQEIIVLTSFEEPRSIARKDGIAACLKKPIETEKLVHAIAELTAGQPEPRDKTRRIAPAAHEPTVKIRPQVARGT